MGIDMSPKGTQDSVFKILNHELMLIKKKKDEIYLNNIPCQYAVCVWWFCEDKVVVSLFFPYNKKRAWLDVGKNMWEMYIPVKKCL